MPKISTRAQEMPASPLRKLAGIAEERKKNGTIVHHLNIGQPDMPTPQAFLDGVKNFSQNPIAYTMSQGMEEAITGWQSYYKTVGIELAQNEIMITTGGSEALIFAMAAVCDPGENVIVFEPFYTNYNGFGKLGGIEVRPVTLTLETGFHLPSDEEIEKAINEKTRALMICNPGNPTGTVLSKSELERIIQIAIKHDLFIISDEVYREFAFEEKAFSMLEFEEAAERVIVCDSASKRFNACGIRIGVLASHNQDVMTAAVKFGMARLSVATIEQMALIPVLEQAQTLIPPIVAEYKKRRDAVYEALQKIPGVIAQKPEGAFYSICELPVDSSEDFVKWMIEEFEHEGETVLVAPAPGFYATPGKGKKEIRIAYVLDSQKMQHAIELLGIAIEQYSHRS